MAPLCRLRVAAHPSSFTEIGLFQAFSGPRLPAEVLL
jgi:hypothetical protein